MLLLDLPTEVLTDIISLGGRPALAQTCRTFAALVYSVPCLWSSINLGPKQYTEDGPNHLRARLERTERLPLIISVGPVLKLAEELSELCVTLTEYNTQICELYVTASFAQLAGAVVNDLFPRIVESAVYPGLQKLSVRVDIGQHPYDYDPVWPQLDIVLERAIVTFPGLKALLLPWFYDCLPMLHLSSSFAHLRTLILDGLTERWVQPNVGLIASVLHCTPHLETLWIKHSWRERDIYQYEPFYSREVKGRGNISLSIHLPMLTSLAVAVPGSACDLMGCIDAPNLRDLHLDGSRHRSEYDKWRANVSIASQDGWSHEINCIHEVETSLMRFASRCSSVRRFAMTCMYLTREHWEWLLFGYGEGPPFPHMHTIALHDRALYAEFDDYDCEFDDELLFEFAQRSSIPLCRLVMLDSTFSVSGKALVEVFRSRIEKEVNQQCELVCDSFLQNGDDYETLETLEALGVRVTSKGVENTWWERGHGIDGSDEHVY